MQPHAIDACVDQGPRMVFTIGPCCWRIRARADACRSRQSGDRCRAVPAGRADGPRTSPGCSRADLPAGQPFALLSENALINACDARMSCGGPVGDRSAPPANTHAAWPFRPSRPGPPTSGDLGVVIGLDYCVLLETSYGLRVRRRCATRHYVPGATGIQPSPMPSQSQSPNKAVGPALPRAMVVPSRSTPSTMAVRPIDRWRSPSPRPPPGHRAHVAGGRPW